MSTLEIITLCVDMLALGYVLGALREKREARRRLRRSVPTVVMLQSRSMKPGRVEYVS